MVCLVVLEVAKPLLFAFFKIISKSKLIADSFGLKIENTLVFEIWLISRTRFLLFIVLLILDVLIFVYWQIVQFWLLNLFEILRFLKKGLNFIGIFIFEGSFSWGNLLGVGLKTLRVLRFRSGDQFLWWRIFYHFIKFILLRQRL